MSLIMRKPVLCHMWTTKAQISLRIHAVWSAPFAVQYLDSIISILAEYIISRLANLWSKAGQFESYLVTNSWRQVFSSYGSHVSLWWLKCDCNGHMSSPSVIYYLSSSMTKPTNDLCGQQRLRSAWASHQSDQSLHCPHEETMGLGYP